MRRDQPIVELCDVTVLLGGKRRWLRPATPPVRAVGGVSLSLRPGEILGLVGESGCGKTTLGRTVLGLQPETAGEIRLDGEVVSALAPKKARRVRGDIQYVHQDAAAALDPWWSIGRTLEEGLRIHGVASRAERRERVDTMLEAVGLDRWTRLRYPHELSGGQLRRVALARILVLRPRFVVLDEPTSGLDMSVQATVLNLLLELRQRFGLTYLFISHDLSVVRRFCERVAIMYLGRIVELAPADQIFAEPRHPYTRALLAAVPRLDASERPRVPPLPGDPPNAARLPPGCVFSSRCQFTEPTCREEEPALSGEPGHAVACWRWRELLPDPHHRLWLSLRSRKDPLLPDTLPLSLSQIPVLDVSAYLGGTPGALDAAAAELRFALENIGFFYLAGHGVPQALIDRIFAETRRFHVLPLDEKMKLQLNRSNNGYMPLRGHAQRHTNLNKTPPKPNENESFFAKRERDPNNPDVIAKKDLRDPNQWPDNLPGFKETVLEYQDVMRRLVHRLLPVYARALDLPADYFAPFFHKGGEITVRMIHYPPATPEQMTNDVFGTAAHTDRNLFTILAQGDTPGLQIMLPDRRWIPAPILPGAFVVNSGDTLRRWSNDRFLSTPHRVLNTSGRDRYSVPFFVSPEYDTVLECLPTCHGPDNLAKYPPVTMEAFTIEFLNRNYANRNQQVQWSAEKAGVL